MKVLYGSSRGVTEILMTVTASSSFAATILASTVVAPPPPVLPYLFTPPWSLLWHRFQMIQQSGLGEVRRLPALQFLF